MKNKDKNQEKKCRICSFLLLFFILTGVEIVLGLLCIENSRMAFIQTHKTLFIVLVILLLFLFCGICIWGTITQKDVLLKGAITIYIFTVFCLTLIYIFQKTGFFEVVNDSEKLQAYIEKSGAFMPILYIVLQFLQVIVLPIPSIVSTLAGLALFGPFKTMIYSLCGILPASFLAFIIGRKLGKKAVAWIVGSETLEKWQKKLKKKDNLFLTAMFLLPFFPDDVLCFLAGLSSMSLKYFLIMILVSRVLAVGATCYSFDFIPFNTWWGIIIWIVFFVGATLLISFIYKNMEKIYAWLQRFKKKR